MEITDKRQYNDAKQCLAYFEAIVAKREEIDEENRRLGCNMDMIAAGWAHVLKAYTDLKTKVESYEGRNGS